MKQYTLEGRRLFLRNAPSGSTDSFGGAFLKQFTKKSWCWPSWCSPFSLQSFWIKMTTLWPLLCSLLPPTVFQSVSSRWTQRGRGRSICCVSMVSVAWVCGCCSTSALSYTTCQTVPKYCCEGKPNRADLLVPGEEYLFKTVNLNTLEERCLAVQTARCQGLGTKTALAEVLWVSLLLAEKFSTAMDQLPHTGFCAWRGGSGVSVKCKQVLDYPDKMVRGFPNVASLSGFHTDRWGFLIILSWNKRVLFFRIAAFVDSLG